MGFPGVMDTESAKTWSPATLPGAISQTPASPASTPPLPPPPRDASNRAANAFNRDSGSTHPDNASAATSAMRSWIISPILCKTRSKLQGALAYHMPRNTLVMRNALVLPPLVAALGIIFSATDSFASGISVARFGSEHGHPTTTNPTAIFYNPAGIGKSDGGHGYADLNTAWRHSTYERPASPSDDPAPAGGEGANVGKASLLNLSFSPFLGATYALAPIAVGLAYYTPYGGQSTWSRNDRFENDTQFPGAVDGVQRWYSIEGEIRSSFFSAAVAYDFGIVSVGLSANLIQTVVHTIRARDPTGGNDLRDEGRSWIDVDSWDFSAGAGVVFEPIHRKLLLGLSYQSRPSFGGGITASGTLTTVLANGARDSNHIDFHTNLPDVIRAGGSYRASDDLELRLFGDYQRWSALQNHCVSPAGASCAIASDGSAKPGSEVILNQVRDWHDTFGVRAGASYWLDRDVETFAGLGFASNAIPDKTLEPALLDFNTISAAIGGTLALTESIHFGASYTQVFYISRDTTGESIHPTLTGPNGLGSPSRNPDSGGKYAQQLGIVNVNLDVAF